MDLDNGENGLIPCSNGEVVSKGKRLMDLEPDSDPFLIKRQCSNTNTDESEIIHRIVSKTQIVDLPIDILRSILNSFGDRCDRVKHADLGTIAFIKLRCAGCKHFTLKLNDAIDHFRFSFGQDLVCQLNYSSKGTIKRSDLNAGYVDFLIRALPNCYKTVTDLACCKSLKVVEFLLNPSITYDSSYKYDLLRQLIAAMIRSMVNSPPPNLLVFRILIGNMVDLDPLSSLRQMFLPTYGDLLGMMAKTPKLQIIDAETRVSSVCTFPYDMLQFAPTDSDYVFKWPALHPLVIPRMKNLSSFRVRCDGRTQDLIISDLYQMLGYEKEFESDPIFEPPISLKSYSIMCTDDQENLFMNDFWSTLSPIGLHLENLSLSFEGIVAMPGTFLPFKNLTSLYVDFLAFSVYANDLPPNLEYLACINIETASRYIRYHPMRNNTRQMADFNLPERLSTLHFGFDLCSSLSDIRIPLPRSLTKLTYGLAPHKSSAGNGMYCNNDQIRPIDSTRRKIRFDLGDIPEYLQDPDDEGWPPHLYAQSYSSTRSSQWMYISEAFINSSSLVHLQFKCFYWRSTDAFRSLPSLKSLKMDIDKYSLRIFPIIFQNYLPRNVENCHLRIRNDDSTDLEGGPYDLDIDKNKLPNLNILQFGFDNLYSTIRVSPAILIASMEMDLLQIKGSCHPDDKSTRIEVPPIMQGRSLIIYSRSMISKELETEVIAPGRFLTKVSDPKDVRRMFRPAFV